MPHALLSKSATTRRATLSHKLNSPYLSHFLRIKIELINMLSSGKELGPIQLTGRTVDYFRASL